MKKRKRSGPKSQKSQKKPGKNLQRVKPTSKKPAKKPTPSKPADSFPGYPHYPAGDDIMNPRKGYEKMEFNETSRKMMTPKKKRPVKGMSDEMEKPLLPDSVDAGEEEYSPSDLLPEEKNMLEAEGLSEDMGEDEALRSRVWDVDVSGDDLDVPGSELDDEAEEVGEEDEENNLYSLGGDRHEDLEQNHDPGR